MFSRRAFARVLGGAAVTAVIASGIATPGVAFAATVALRSASPAVGSIVKPSAATAVTACFTKNLNPLSTLTLSTVGAPGTPVLGATAAAIGCPVGGDGLTFTPQSALSNGDYQASYNVTDTDLPIPTTASGSFVFRVDGTAPGAPTLNNPPTVSSTTPAPSLSGTAEALHAASGGINPDVITVTLTVTGNGPTVTRTTSTDSSGNYTFSNVDVSGLGDGILSYAVKATDSAGNTGSATTKTGSKDTSGPTLSSSTPAAGSSNRPTQTATLSFNEDLDKPTSSAELRDKLGTVVATSPTNPDNHSIALSTAPGTMGEAASPYTVVYTVHDTLGNTETGQFTFTIDNTAPAQPTGLAAPQIVVANQNTYAVTGTAEPGSTVSVDVTDGALTVSGSAPAANDGSFSVGTLDVHGLADGATITVNATATDAAGNVSPIASTTTTKDATAPSAPTSVDMSKPVNNANQTAVHVTGDVAADVTNVTVSVDDAAHPETPAVVVSTVQPSNAHAFDQTVDVTSLADGTLTATVTGYDAAGNVSSPATATATKDASIPAAPSVAISPKPINASDAATAKVSGVAEAGSSVHLTLDDEDAGTSPVSTDVTAANDGTYSWSPDLSQFSDGTLTATGTATDGVGNTSSVTQDSASMDRSAPAQPTSLAAPTFASPVNDTAYAVTGAAEKGATVSVSITDSAATVRSATGSADASTGAFNVPVDVSQLLDGALTVSVTASDASGNVSPAASISRQKDTAAPAAPSITSPALVTTANRVAYDVSGTAENGSTVYVTVDDGDVNTPVVTGSGPADASTGAFSVPLDLSTLSDGPLSFSAIAADAAGSQSTAGTASGSKDTTTLAAASHTPAAATQTPSTVTMTFNEPLDTSGGSSTILVENAVTSAVAGTTSFANGNRTIVFTPSSPSALGEAGSPYSVRVDAHDPNGDSVTNETFSFIVDNTAPAAPTVSTVTSPVKASNQQTVTATGLAEAASTVLVTITDGVHHVTAQSATTNNGSWSATPIDTTSLTDGTLTATAVATDAAGNASPLSSPLTTSKDATPPAAPTGVAVTNPVNAASQHSIGVTGTAEPASAVTVTITDGVKNVLANTTTADDGSWSASGIDVGSLADGTLSVTAAATDAVGNDSPSSSAVTTIKRTILPDAPTGVAATAQDGAALVAWQAPASTGGVAVDHYVLTVTPTGSVTNVSGTSKTVSGLTNGTTYTFTVAAVTIAGTGPASAPSAATPRTTPGVPTGLTVTPGNAKLDVSWAAPSSNGGNAVATYTATLTRHSDGSPVAQFTTTDATTLSHSFANLTNGTAYDVAVVATNAAGSSATPATATGTPRKAPGAPTGLTITPSDSALAISWSAPADNGGAPVQSYTVTLTPRSGGSATTFTTPDATTTTHAFTGLTNGSTYDVSVVATNVAGNSSGILGSGTPGLKPGAPTVTATPADAAVAATWAATAPAGHPITEYDVTVTSGGAARPTTSYTTKSSDAGGLQTSHVFSGLTNGTEYVVAVTAVNNLGGGPAGSATATPRFVSTTTIAHSASRILYGTKLTLSGVVTRSDGRRVAGSVTILRRLDGSTVKRYTTVTANSNGVWTFTSTPTRNATYYARYVGSTVVASSTSPGSRTLISPKVVITSPKNKSASSATTKLKLTGTVSPTEAGKTVTLYSVSKSGKLTKLAAAKLSSKSAFTFLVALKRGTWHLQVVAPAVAGNMSGRSATWTVRRV